MCDDFTGGNETMLVWRLRYNGTTMYLDNLIQVAGIIEHEIFESEEGDEIKIKQVRMKRKAFEALPEFDGF